MFSYEPLNPHIDSLRLLVLLPPTANGDEIGCELEHRTFGSKPIYEALSYTWGSEPASTTIKINGQPFLVRENLYNALWHLRLSTPRVIWVDAVCINQGDIPERNSQVSLMAFIYTRAQRVLVWLGLSPGPVHNDYFSDSHWYAMSHHPYWSRLWIIQELVLANHVLFYLGHYSFGWERVSSTMNPEWRALRGGAELIMKLCNERHKNAQRLENLIEVFQEAQCTEKRDKIFGFLGLVYDGAEEMIEVDYEMGYFHLFTLVLEFHQTTIPFDSKFPKELDRSVKLMKFSQLVQKVLGGAVEEDARTKRESKAPALKKFYTARGSLAGEILYLGPTYTQAISSVRADRMWKQTLEETYQARSELHQLRKDNEAYSRVILDWDQTQLERIRKIHTRASYGYRWSSDDEFLTINENDLHVPDVSEPRRFLGTRALIGVVPPEATVGDLVYTFFGCDVAVVLRKIVDKESDRFIIVGRADVSRHVRMDSATEREVEAAIQCDLKKWARDERDKALNDLSFQNMINLRLDVETLQKLTF